MIYAIGVFRIGKALETIDMIVTEFIRLPDNPRPESLGGYLTIINRSDGTVRLIIKIGSVTDIEKRKKCFLFSQEKAERLFVKQVNGDLSSWQSRDVKNKKYGGAIAVKDYILSFSGLPELGDEVVMLVVGVHLGLLKIDQAQKIAAVSENPFFGPLFDKCFSEMI